MHQRERIKTQKLLRNNLNKQIGKSIFRVKFSDHSKTHNSDKISKNAKVSVTFDIYFRSTHFLRNRVKKQQKYENAFFKNGKKKTF